MIQFEYDAHDFGLWTCTVDGFDLDLTRGDGDFSARFPIPMDHVPEAVWRAALAILFARLDTEQDLADVEPWLLGVEHKRGGAAVLGYSGGVDSTAVLLAHPKAIPIYIERPWAESYGLASRAAINEAGSCRIYTDVERIQMLARKPPGFSVGCGYVSLLLPLAYATGAPRIMLGVVFDDVSFSYRLPFRFQDTRPSCTVTAKVARICSAAGIDLVYPWAGVSEVVATRVVADSRFADLASSCHTADGSHPCMRCPKCLRKQGILGRRFDLTDPGARALIQTWLRKAPLKMACAMVYGIQAGRYGGDPWSRYRDIDVSFLNRYHPGLLREYGTDESAREMEGYLASIGVLPWNEDDPDRMERFVAAINDPDLYEGVTL